MLSRMPFIPRFVYWPFRPDKQANCSVISTSPSRRAAVVILPGAMLVAGRRVRWRVIHSERCRSTHCPRWHSTESPPIRRHFLGRALGGMGLAGTADSQRGSVVRPKPPVAAPPTPNVTK